MTIANSTTAILRNRIWHCPTAQLLLPALVAAMVLGTSSYSAASSADASSTSAERSDIDSLLSENRLSALAAVQAVRKASKLQSTLPPAAINSHLADLLRWVVHDYANNLSVRLLSAVPDGQAAGRPESSTRLRQLQKTYWLQDNALYGAGALMQYAPALGRLLSQSWRTHWERTYPDFCPDTQSDVVVGALPAYERGSAPTDSRCRLPTPGDWQYLRMRQYPDPADAAFDSLQTPIIGTDYPADRTGHVQMAAISRKSARDLFKYGCLRQSLLGHTRTAQQMFDLAMTRWDGNGFANPKNDPESGGRLVGVYWTRDLAFALMCANALGVGTQSQLGSVQKAQLEQKLWSAQSPSGGMWSNYCSPDASDCKLNIPAIAKQTNEVAPLVLLAYGSNIWAPTR